ncbi:MAG: type II secretion system F family protein [Pseudomonadota bacterium]
MNLQKVFANLPFDAELLLYIGVPVVGLILLLIAMSLLDSRKQDMRRRVEQIRVGRTPKEHKKDTVNAKRNTAESNIAAIDRLIKSALPRRELLRKRLDRAGLRISIARYLLFCLAAGAAGTAFNIVIMPMPPAAAVLSGVFIGFGFPHLIVGLLAKRRANKFLNAFPDAIDLMVRGLKSGLPITESIKTAGEEVPDPVGEELRQVTDAVRLGQKLENVLWDMSERLDLQEFKFFTVSLAIQSETGGNLSETLQNLSNVLRGRRQLKLKIKAMSSEAKASAYIIGCLPFVVGFFIYLVNAEYITKLFIDPRGHLMMAVGGIMFLIGGTVMYKLVKFDI